MIGIGSAGPRDRGHARGGRRGRRGRPTWCSIVAALAAVAAGCGGSDGPRGGAGGAAGGQGGSGGAGGLGGPGDFSVEERRRFERGGRQATSIQQSIVLADTLFDFDPTLVPSETAAMNAQNIADNVRLYLPADVCGSVSVAGTTVTVSFGSGCTLKNGVVASGTVSAGVSKAADGTLSVILTFTSLVVNGKDLGGMVTFATKDGSTFAVTGTLTSGGDTTTLNLTVKGAAATFTVSGQAEYTEDGTKTMLVFGDLVYTLGACYPSGGSLTITKGMTTMTVTCNAATATTGVVTVSTRPGKTTTSMLPAYGSCPAAGDGGVDARADAGAGADVFARPEVPGLDGSFGLEVSREVPGGDAGPDRPAPMSDAGADDAAAADAPDDAAPDAGADAAAKCGRINCDCTFKGKRLWGRVRFVTSLPDLRVRVVTALPDLRVQNVTALANGCGKWQEVMNLPDLNVQLVTSLEDFSIEYVTSLPGVANSPSP